MIRVNLLPEAKRKVAAVPKLGMPKFKFELPIAWIIGGLAAVLVTCIALAVFHLTLQKNIKKIQGDIAQVEQQIATLKIDIAKVEEAKRRKNQLIQKLEVIDTLKRQQSGPVRLLDVLASCIPPKLWLQEISEDGKIITITGNTLEENSIAQFMTNMEKSNFFIQVELSSSKTTGALKMPGVTAAEAPQVKEFLISAAYSGGKGAEKLGIGGPTTPKATETANKSEEPNKQQAKPAEGKKAG